MRTQRLPIGNDAVLSMTAGAPCPHPTDDVGDLAVVRIEQLALADQRVFDLARELQPLLSWAQAQIAEGAHRPLAGGPFGVWTDSTNR